MFARITQSQGICSLSKCALKRSFSSASGTFPKHLKTMSCLSNDNISSILELAQELKQDKSKFSKNMLNKTLLMIFSKPSLRTRLSFETGMTQMGGHAIYYPLDSNSNLGGKETVEDTAKVVSRYADVVMARVASRHTVNELAEFSSVPVINALDDWGHPCQILADFQTMLEQQGDDSTAAPPASLAGKKLTYIGDLQNNVTYDLARGGLIMGMHIHLAGPTTIDGKPSYDYTVEDEVVDELKALAVQHGGEITLHGEDSIAACSNADYIYADSFMSYHIDKAAQDARLNALMPFQVTEELMKTAPDAKFLHCLPAVRGLEVQAEVIDGPQSVVFDQAENRLHAQKALMLFLTNNMQPTA